MYFVRRVQGNDPDEERESGHQVGDEKRESGHQVDDDEELEYIQFSH